ncbi:MAG: hypothetical protein ABR985_02605 [Methanotrichaceae archaeon]|jgi:hypothetical protein
MAVLAADLTAGADTNTILLAAAIGAGSAIIASIVSSLTYYYIEKGDLKTKPVNS